ncbi:MAG: LysM peptidoglycan-binding domain-containing protein [Lewinellaceae bacterium]|nr:hypothetical protein [Lewinella sp.]MCB9278189.1 LysM peptidoglycan-binding domain-containing protein [Lewinellaceae bacterium]
MAKKPAAGSNPKLKIWAYKDPDFTQLAPGFSQALEVSINPEKYKRVFKPLTYDASYSVKLANGDRIDGRIVDPPPETFQLELWFDGTGAVPGTGEVYDEIEKLQQYALYYNGSIHSNHYVKIEWGGDKGLLFKGQLQSISIDYMLFDSNGKPLRAKADVSFKQFIDAQTRESLKNKSSPDLTHVRVVRDGDNLPMMCFAIYQDPGYYLQVAEFNGLSNFMDLRPGQKIIFPPLEN